MSRTASACTMSLLKVAVSMPRSIPALSDRTSISFARPRGWRACSAAQLTTRSWKKSCSPRANNSGRLPRRSDIRRAERARSLRHEHPVIQIEDHRRVVVVAALERKICARLILGGDGAQAQRADVLAAGHFGGGQHLGPGKYRQPCEQRRHVPPAIDRRHVEGIAEPVE